MPISPRTQLAALSLAALALTALAVRQPDAVRAQNTGAQAGPNPGTVDYYQQKVKPIFDANCMRCHGGMNHRGGLNMDTRAGLLKGGHDGAVLDAAHPEQSLLIKLIRHEGPANDPMPMPPAPRAKLPDADIATVTAWVKAGAPMPEEAAGKN
jgi:mono/diheme cytochrome c family protein